VKWAALSRKKAAMHIVLVHAHHHKIMKQSEILLAPADGTYYVVPEK
jgi:hypothetical protein